MADMASTRFGEVLRHARQAAGLTQAELAELAGLSRRGIADLEGGTRQHPRKDTVALLAKALCLTGQEQANFAAAAWRHIGQTESALRTASPPTIVHSESVAPALPAGAVTFLLIDLEGSSRLLEQLGAERYAQVRGKHGHLLRTAIAAHNGREVDMHEDSFFVAFSTAGDALAAAAQAQRALATHPWPPGATVRVRMALHTGEAQVVGVRYVGLNVHRTARIVEAGHGGQVLLSQTTRDLVEHALPEGATLRDMGTHRLKDLQWSEHLWQLVLPNLPGIPGEFPPLVTLETHLHNLPIQPTPLLGREQEVAAVVGLLQREDVRLVTLTGAGGTGKTRVGLQVAAELVETCADGVWFVSLSRLTDPGLVLPTIAQTIGVREVGGQPMATTLKGYLRDKQIALVLDNFEHVAAAATAVARLLEVCAGLKVLVTSRVALRLRGEKQVQVHPLPLPDPVHLPPPEYLVQYPAVALFVQRALDIDATFALTDATVLAIAAICARVDGLPLAIELAAARVRVLPPTALLARLERQLPVLTGGARDLPERQQTLRATLVWSENLLSSEERRLFRRLAVFVDGFTLAAAEAVCTAPDGAEPLGLAVVDGLGALVDQSLVKRWSVGRDGADEEEEGGEVRFRMLYVIREYALERLEASVGGSGDQAGQEAEALHRAHAVYFLALAERAEPELQGPAQVAWLDRLEREHDNFRTALAWAQAHPRTEAERGLRLAAALEPFWFARGHLREGRAWTEGLLDVVAPHQGGGADTHGEVSAVVWARALKAAGWLAIFTGEDYGPTAARLEAAVAAARAAGDLRTTAAALSVFDAAAYFEGDLARSAMRLEESLALFRASGSEGDVALILSYLGEVALLQGDVARATALSEEALTLARRAGQLQAEVYALCIFGELAQRRGDLPTALALHRQGLALARELADPRRIANTLEYLVNVVVAAGHGEQAARLLGTATALREAIGAPRPSVERTLIEQEVAAARQALGEEAWAAAFAAGRAMTIEEALAEVLN